MTKENTYISIYFLSFAFIINSKISKIINAQQQLYNQLINTIFTFVFNYSSLVEVCYYFFTSWLLYSFSTIRIFNLTIKLSLFLGYNN
jgi:hypothetical protein